MGSISILEIRKSNFIENSNYDNFCRLADKIENHKEIFDNVFFAKATEKAISIKDIKGLLYISQLYLMLERHIEAEYILRQAYKMDNTDNEIIYWFFDILCIRKQYGSVLSLIRIFNKSKDEEKYVKSMIKYYLLAKNEKELNKFVQYYFDKYKNDKEFVNLVFIAAVRNDNYYFTYLVSKTKYILDFLSTISGINKNIVKKHFYIMINNLLIGKIHGTKDC